MSKAKVSDKFSQFEQRNEHKLEEHRKAEKQSRGNPLPVGFVGKGIISDAHADISKQGVPYAVVTVTVVDDPDFEGKSCAGAIRSFKDSERQTKEEAYANFLDDLEDMGLPRQIRESQPLAGCFDYLLNEPHYVSITVMHNASTKDKKEVKCYALGGNESAPTAEGPSPEKEQDDTDYSEYEQCIYLGSPHYIIKDNEDGTLELKNVKTGKVRSDVSSDDITPANKE